MKSVLAAICSILVTATVFAQDPVKVDSSHYRVVLENASVRILRVSVAPNEKSPMHAHPDAMVIPLAASKVRFTLADGKSEDAEMPAESAMYTPAGTHSPTNVGTTRADALVIEFKTPGPGKATIPTSREGMAIKVLGEGPRAIAYRSTAGPTFQEPAGSKHDYDQVVIALGNVSMSLSLDGKPAKTSWSRGETVFIPRGTAHESKNMGGKPVDFIIVAIK